VTAGDETPRIRAVVLNYNGGDLTLECLRRLCATEWPADRFEIVLVDNASSDDVVDRVRAEWPDVRIITSDRNLGFAGGCNLALRDLDGVDNVALVNSDVLVERNWLAPLARVLRRNQAIGAAGPKILFASHFREVELRCPTHRPGRFDRRRLGVRLSGSRIDGSDVWRDTQLCEGFWGREEGPEPESSFQWTSGRAVLRVPVAEQKPSDECELRLAAEEATAVTVLSGGREIQLEVGTEPEWHTVPLGGRPFDVVNNVGTVLTRDGYGADRGYLERDHGQFENPEYVFAWCGGAVLLTTRYVADAGLFDERLFLYYEDVELAWRGRERGWKYRYVPDSVVRHVHAASTVEGSPLFDFYNERNRLLTLTRHAGRAMVVKALARYLLVTGSYARRDIVSPALRGRVPRPLIPLRRLRAFGAYLGMAGCELSRQR
jgi:GT2 family glycosyltransferase